MFKPKRIPWLIGFMLLFYWIIIAASGSNAENDSNLVSIVDRAVLGLTHMYTDHLSDGSSVVFDPEGLLSTLPCIAHVLLGFWAGKLISESKDNGQRIQKLFIFGTIIMFMGFLLNYGFPINKKIWSSGFVLATCGLASLFFGLLTWIIDLKGKKQWSVFFESFGVNPLFIFVIATIISILLGNIGFKYYGEWLSTKGFIYTQWLTPIFGNYLGSLVFALLFVSINWLIGHILYKRKIYIKI